MEAQNKSVKLSTKIFGVHVLHLDMGLHWIVPAFSGLTLFAKGTIVGGDRKMHVIGGVQEDSACWGYLMEPAPIAGLPI